MEPWREALRIAESRELAPGEEECLLDRVLGTLDIAKDPIRDRVAQVAVQVDQFREGDVVAVRARSTNLVRMGGTPAAPDWALHPTQMVALSDRFKRRPRTAPIRA